MDEEAERECENARHFTTTLCALLPSLLAVRSTIEVDEAMLEFSAKYCEGWFTVLQSFVYDSLFQLLSCMNLSMNVNLDVIM